MARLYGDGTTDYEKYVRSKELYELVKEESSWANEDECLFQVTHMAMELWLSVVIQHIDKSVAQMDADEVLPAARMLNRAAGIIDFLIDSLRFLEEMTPWNYHEIRIGLGKGSGQQSPTFNHLLGVHEPIWKAYSSLLKRRSKTVDEIHQAPKEHDDLYQMTAALMTFDENFMRWRYTHFQMVKRIIGDKVLSLKGIPASALREGGEKALFPELWEAISRTTQVYNEKHGAPGNSAYIIPDGKKK